MKSSPAVLIALLVAILFGWAKVYAIPITLFQDTDTFLDRAKDIVIARCVSIPKQDGPADDGLFPVQVDVLLVLKGDKKTGDLKVATIYPMKTGTTYMLYSLGGSALGTDFLAIPELSVVPIPKTFDLETLKGKKAKEQVQKVFASYLSEVEQQLAPLLKTQSLLEKAVRDRTDDLYESKGEIRITAIHEATTKNQSGRIILDLPAGELQWSHSAPGKSGFLYFTHPGVDGRGSRWEFALSTFKDLREFDRKPLKVRFYGEDSPHRENTIGLSSRSAILVQVGQIVLARTIDHPDRIYLLKIDSQKKEKEEMSVKYILVGK